MIKNDDGLVAIRYYQPIPKLVQIGNKQHFCDVKFGISLTFVPEEEVQSVLAHIGGCCGGQRRVFSLASQEAYNIWKTGNR